MIQIVDGLSKDARVKAGPAGSAPGPPA